MPSPQVFGGSWTETKLKILQSYLKAYSTIFTANEKARFFNTFYVDAFRELCFELLKLEAASRSRPNKQIVLERWIYFERTNRAAFQEFLRLDFFESPKELRLVDEGPVAGLDITRSGSQNHRRRRGHGPYIPYSAYCP